MSYRTWSVSAAAVVTLAGTAMGQQLTTVRVATGFTRPDFLTAPPGDTTRLFVVEQRGSAGTAARADIRIMTLPNYTVLATPFLTVTGMPTNTQTNSEQGLLGLAFDPNYATNGFFYVNYVSSETTNGTTHIVRYHVSADPNVADASSGTNVLTLNQPFTNHNGGWLAFGPDGYLYAALGDGGSGCDPGNRSQNLSSMFGKILRLNVATLPYTIPPTNPFAAGGGLGEIWAYGLRNPWRPSFDRETGDLYIADVGQDYMEEVNFQPAAITPPFTVRNYGWNCREGFVCSTTSPSNCTPPSCSGCNVPVAPTDPVYGYVQAATANCSVTGGYAYRGCAMPSLRGTYFFADYCAAQIWSLRMAGGAATEFTTRTSELAIPGGPSISAIVSFGEDQFGEMYIVTQSSGNIFKIVPRCGANCDSSTTSPVLNVSDFSCFLQKYAAQDCYANCDASTTVPTLNVADFSCFLQKYAAGCSVP